MPSSASIDRDEIDRFSGHASDWWNPDGALRPLHKLNPLRLTYIRDIVRTHFGTEPQALKPLSGLSILDVGCGGGLLCEPMARMGGKVTGVDASSEAIEVARRHARDNKVTIIYRCGSVEALARGKQKFDVITALEIVEHVADISSLLKSVSALLKPGGVVILSTLNRTPKSFLLGIVAAEYLLKWVPPGTHTWKKFLKPSELAAHLKQVSLLVRDVKGMVYNPLDDQFYLSRSRVDVNYLLTASK